MAKLFQKTIISLFIGIGVLFAFGANADTFGYTTAGASNCTLWDEIDGSLFTGVAGTGTSISAYLKTGYGTSWTYKFALYKHSDLYLETNGVTTQGNSAGITYAWKTQPFVSTPTVSAIDYIIEAWANLAGNIAFDSGSVDQFHWTSASYTGNFPNPIIIDGHSTNKLSIYATYTPSEGGAVPVINRSQVIE